MTYHDRIEINPLICSGKPVIKGTRIIVSDLLTDVTQWMTLLTRTHPPTPSLFKRRGECVVISAKSLSSQERDLG
jgi:hypothetical protein